MADLGFELLFRFLWGGVVLLTILDARSAERFPRAAALMLILGGGGAAFFAWSSSLTRSQTFPSLIILLVGAGLLGCTRWRVSRAAGLALSVSSPVFWLAGYGFGHAINFAASGFLLGTAFAGVSLVQRRTNAVIAVLSGALGLRALQVAMTLFLAIGFNARPNVDVMGRPLITDPANTLDLPRLSSAVVMLPLEGDHAFGLGFLGWLILGTRLLWGLLGPWILIYLLKRATRAHLPGITDRIMYTLGFMLLLGEGAALFLQGALGWLV